MYDANSDHIHSMKKIVVFVFAVFVLVVLYRAITRLPKRLNLNRQKLHTGRSGYGRQYIGFPVIRDKDLLTIL